jgi:Tfp pilus assembly protein PilN
MTEQLTQEYSEDFAARSPSAPVRVAWAPVPKVNLLPIEVIESRRFRRTQLMLGGAVLGTVLLAGAGVYLAQLSTDHAQEQLNLSQATVARLEVEEAKYAAVPQVVEQVKAAKTARTLAMGQDVLWYRYLNDLDSAKPAGVELTAMTVTLNGNLAAEASTETINPLSSAGVGALAVSGTAKQYSQVSNWLEAMSDLTGLSSSALFNASKSDDEAAAAAAVTPSEEVTFSTSAIVDSDALSHRYEKKAG